MKFGKNAIAFTNIFLYNKSVGRSAVPKEETIMNLSRGTRAPSPVRLIVRGGVNAIITWMVSKSSLVKAEQMVMHFFVLCQYDDGLSICLTAHRKGRLAE